MARHLGIFLAVAVATTLLAAGGISRISGVRAAPALTRQHFVPIVTSPRRPATPASGGVFVRRDPALHSPDIAVDPNGGIHMAWTVWTADPTGHNGASYAYCPNQTIDQCRSSAAWAVVTLSQNVRFVQLALDPLGRPRLLLQTGEFKGYQYAECNSQCTSAASWGVLPLIETPTLGSSFEFDYSHHSFALDPQGRPRFIYSDFANASGSHTGTFYAFCDASCLDWNSWLETRLSTSDYCNPALAFTSNGQPRLVSSDCAGTVFFQQCVTACDNTASWTRTDLYARGSGMASWTLKIDAQNRPRMAFYQGHLGNGAGNTLYYVWCNSACTSPASWGSWDVGLPQGEGENAALALDDQGRPRIAYQQLSSGVGLGYAWCTASCASTSPTWQAGMREAADVLNADFPMLPAANCDQATWLGGYRPALALDPAGNPRVAYAAIRYSTGGSCSTPHEDWRSVRGLFFSQP